MRDDYDLTAAFLTAGHNLWLAVHRDNRSLALRLDRCSSYGEVVGARVIANWFDNAQNRSLSCEWRCLRSEDLSAAIAASLSAVESGPCNVWVDAVVEAYAALRGEVR
jgi:hypothetical protein